jgi:predicted transporter
MARLLRAMVVPAGHHVIEFKFEPVAWRVGETISLISSILLLLLLGGFLFSLWKKKNNSENKEEIG